MRRFHIIWLGLLLVMFALLAALFFIGQGSAVLEPKGAIGMQQASLIFFVTWLMLIVVIPVFIITVVFAWKYAKRHEKYSPELTHSVMAEVIYWGIPLIIITFIGIAMWKSNYTLDPYRPIESKKEPVTIQVVALDWKWLFIYPKEQVASVNFFQFPVDTPVEFEITADAPMNSFWIPRLGGQIYAMPNMRTKLYLIADHEGDFVGKSANLSGEGFAGMTFVAKASSDAEYAAWVERARGSEGLDLAAYRELAKASEHNPVALYRLEEGQLFDWIIDQYREGG